MTIKETLLDYMYSNVINEPIKQTEIVKYVSGLTGYPYESVRGATFRSKHHITEIYRDFDLIKNKGCNYWVRSNKPNKIEFNYIKPIEYFKGLDWLDDGNVIYSLGGQTKYCKKYNNKIITIDRNKDFKPDIIGDVTKLQLTGNFNFDTEGILNIRKIKWLNKTKLNKVLLTIRKTKNDVKLLELLNFRHTHLCDYKSGKHSMSIYKLQ